MLHFSSLALVLVFCLGVREIKAQGCVGYEDAPMQIVNGSLPDVFEIPSKFTFSVDIVIQEDLPADLVMFLDLKKVDEFPIDVPCINTRGLGSCEYDICAAIENNFVDTWCPQFPDYQPCGCPLLQGELDLVDLPASVPDFGSTLNPLMEGHYQATATFYGKSNPDNVVGCFEFEFDFVIAGSMLSN